MKSEILYMLFVLYKIKCSTTCITTLFVGINVKIKKLCDAKLIWIYENDSDFGGWINADISLNTL